MDKKEVEIRLAKDYEPSDGMVPFLLEGEALGAYPNGTRIVKSVYEDGDHTFLGIEGRVLASHINPADETQYIYFVAWDMNPDLPIAVLGHKISQAGN